MSKQNLCEVCGKPCNGAYLEGAKVYHWACAEKTMEPIRAILREKKIIQ